MPGSRNQHTADPPVGEQAQRRDQILLVVAAIPEGSVATYGQIADYAGLSRRARLVGHVLRGLPSGTRLPWHRVVAAGGRIAVRGGGEHEQVRRLQGEGVPFRAHASTPRVDLARCNWNPGS